MGRGGGGGREARGSRGKPGVAARRGGGKRRWKAGGWCDHLYIVRQIVILLVVQSAHSRVVPHAPGAFGRYRKRGVRWSASARLSERERGPARGPCPLRPSFFTRLFCAAVAGPPHLDSQACTMKTTKAYAIGVTSQDASPRERLLVRGGVRGCCRCRGLMLPLFAVHRYGTIIAVNGDTRATQRHTPTLYM